MYESLGMICAKQDLSVVSVDSVDEVDGSNYHDVRTFI